MKTRGHLSLVALAALLAAGCGDDSTGPEPGPTPLQLDVSGLLPLPDMSDNPLTVEGVALGRKLFHDPILSGDSTQACASCHLQSSGFSDPLQFSVGITGDVGTRNAPTIINAAWMPELFWAGRAASLEDQARGPVPNPIEMNLPWDQALTRLRNHADYPALFGAAFGSEEINEDRVVMAIAQFERTLISKNSKWDRKQRGEATFTASEARGERLYFTERGDCFHCHGSALFTDNQYHDNGLDAAYTDLGRGAVTGFSFDNGKMRSPTLRNIEVSGPYMHDGRFQTLEEVIEHYSSGLQASPNLDPLLKVPRPDGPQEFTDQEKADLVAFLKTLTDPTFLNNPEFGPPTE